MNNYSTLTAKRRYPKKPVQVSPVLRNKTINLAQGIELLNSFMSEARKELRKRDSLKVQGKFVNCDCEQLTFCNEELSITIDFKGGMAV